MTTAIFSNIHDYGVYYRGPIGAIKDEYQKDFRLDFDLADDDTESIVVADLDCFEDDSEIEYDYTDHIMFEDLKQEIFKGKYEQYLEYTTCGNWLGQAGYRFRTQNNAFEYGGEDCTMHYLSRSASYKYFCFFKSSHDVPTGANNYYIGLTDREYQYLSDADFDDVINWVEEKLSVVKWIEKW